MNPAADSLDPPTNPAPSHEDRPTDADSTRYTATPPAQPADPEATSYKASAPPDPEQTNYAPSVSPGRRDAFQARRVGNYELLEEVARGGMGVVYRAQQISPPRPVALKMILAGQFAAPEAIERFHVEARATAALDHPNIVPIFEVGELEGRPFLSMPFIGGGSLQQQLIAGPLEPREASLLLKPVAEAVQYAHERGVIHRDIKPANILLQRDEGSPGGDTSVAAAQPESAGHATPAGKPPSPRLTDFGLARLAREGDALTATGQEMGTPSYMPPEQAAGRLQDIGPRSDVYSLGAVLYCLLTGRPPFQSASVHETLRQVREEEPVPLRQLNAGVPLDLETVCLKCLAKDTARRYSSAAELVAELERFLAGRPVQARPVGVVERVWRWYRRNRLVGRLLAAVAGTLITGTTIATYFAIENGQLAERASINEKKALKKEGETRQALDDLKARQSQLARSFADISDQEFLRGNVRNSLNWMLRAYQVAPETDALRQLPPPPRGPGRFLANAPHPRRADS